MVEKDSRAGMKLTRKTGFFFLLLSMPLFIPSQIKKKIDTLLFKTSIDLRKEGKYDDLLKLSQEIILLSQKNNYLEGEAWGYSRLGNVLCTLGDYKKSLSSLDKAYALQKKINDVYLETTILIEIGRNYSESEVSYEKALKYFKKAEGLSKQINNVQNRNLTLRYIFQNLFSTYWHLGQKETSVSYLRTSLKMEKDAYSLSYLTYYHLYHTHQKDSLLYYLNETKLFLDDHQNINFERALHYNHWGKYYEEEKKYDSAIFYFQKAEKLSKTLKIGPEYINALYRLSKCYEIKKEPLKSANYMKKFADAQDSINLEYKDNVSHSIKRIIKEESNHKDESFSKIKKVLIVFIVLVVFVVILIFKRMRKVEQNKAAIEKKIVEQEDELTVNKLLTTELQQKLNESFEEVVQLAKDNSPEFLTRFKEVYPDFVQKLLLIDSKLRVSELTLSAYIFLGFKTKDIAYYTYKSTNTIRNRKYNLRKKLGISENEEMEIWFKML